MSGLRAGVIGVFLPFAFAASAQSTAPLSVIDWLDKPAPLGQLPRAPAPRASKPAAKPVDEPAVTNNGSAPHIITRSLDAGAPANVGLVPPAVTGMKPDLWVGSDVADLARRLNKLPDLELPASNALLFTLLLTEASAPNGTASAQNALTLARAEKLMALGAVDPALALLEQAGASTSRSLFDLWAQLGLLVGTEDTACGALSRARYLTNDAGLQIFCAARGGDWDTAALTFGSAKALSLLPRETLDVLDRFLNPDVFEDAAPLKSPRKVDPLTFRLFETIGEPLPTGPLPRAYAVADLRDIAGWKSQLEAAERLTRAGALPDNRLLGLYTNRQPAASGGIWDRVRAVQRFDTALNTNSVEAVSKTLPAAWHHMREAELEVSFATAFYDRITEIELTGKAARIKARMGLLSPAYEMVAVALGDEIKLGPEMALIRAVAQGEAVAKAPSDALPRAINDAFSTPAPRQEWIEMAKTQRLGEALLATLDSLRDGARGDSRALRESLGTLRALGLEDTARRAALQILLLERSP
ncbi:hypothetical protein OS189_03015 [Sulfitobacter sp. F26169L]|uniref:hypothetical protein n=1 Tax=Sulfitobacter sp. F26169L TaxID=2996015 RepID=UPI002260B994|nr:hypothetical protein [Sulfitobacter sp. F26169L]MCX7565313.1 hypothetical protein [Sulfitobacter sp. F26169L]